MEPDFEKLHPEEPTAEQFQPIIDLYSQGEVQEALRLIKKLQEDFPKSAFLFDFAGACNAEMMSFEKSIQSYKEAIKIKPNFSDAYNNMGNVHLQIGNLVEAIECFTHAIKIEPNYTIAHFNLANAKLDKSDLEGAKEGFKRVIENDPDHDKAFYMLANLHRDEGDIEEAINCYKQALKINPEFAEAYNNLGNAIQANLQRDEGDIEEAINCYKQALKINPEFAEAYNNLGNAIQANLQRDEGDIEEAINCYKQALKINPEFAEAYNNFGSALLIQGEYDYALDNIKKALILSPNFSDAYNNLGNAYKDKKDFSKALESFKEALKIDPFNAQAFYNMGNVFLERSELDFAIDSYKQAVNINPVFADAYLNLGNAFRDKGSSDMAINCFSKALECKPGYAVAEFNQALTYLDKEEFRKGWVLYERRWDSVSFGFDYLNSSVQKWQLGKNGRLLLWQEQGVGDAIMFSSIIPELYLKCEKLFIQVDKRLIPIFNQSFPDDIVYYTSEEKVPEDIYDYQIPMGSLPLYFRNDIDSFKYSSGKYLSSDELLSIKLRKMIQNNHDDCIVGISWRGGSKINSSSRYRSMELNEITRIFNHERFNLVNLQYGDTDRERKLLKSQKGLSIKDISEIDNLNNLHGLSALIDACDYVVSIDNLTVNIAGALGKKTFVLLPFSPNWRWGKSRDESIWHSSLCLLRQSKIADWSSPLMELKKEFENILKNTG